VEEIDDNVRGSVFGEEQSKQEIGTREKVSGVAGQLGELRTMAGICVASSFCRRGGQRWHRDGVGCGSSASTCIAASL